MILKPAISICHNQFGRKTAMFSSQNISHTDELTINVTDLDFTKDIVFASDTSISVDDCISNSELSQAPISNNKLGYQL